MILTNNTSMIADWSLGYQKDGRDILVIVIKSTYDIPEDEDNVVPQLSEEQMFLVQADISIGEPGYSSVLYETDYSLFKPYCDVLFNGCAHSFYGELVTSLDVSLQVGGMHKEFRVKGNRFWNGFTIEPFSVMPISYDNAFGGLDNTDVKKMHFFRENPIGKGFSYHKKNLKDISLPNTEEIGKPVRIPDGKYKPMALGSISRTHPERIQYAGTYDKEWVANRMPFYPDDFDFRYFQSAPAEQQIPYVQGGERVVLTNLSAKGIQQFYLPKFICPVTFIMNRGINQQVNPVVDTLLIEPEYKRFSMVARVNLPLKNDMFDVKEVVVGEMPRIWHHKQRSPNKQYYNSFADIVAQKSKGEIK
ncbi:DUF2169 domain-containing protein [Pragia fontium]|uniref:DUF2169 family type VI secretion system accessory protein n=1 Tax=Pragia fontium TaxID=82985 RepID=UPI000649D945|nr:DUF2169 domain-containing protein [Pragia fontium]AKJ41635.1 hypothetical protein QQ39_05675 [Pragia fontium]